MSSLYDAEGNRSRLTHPDGVFFTFGYDGRNRLTQVGENGISGFNLVGAFAYHATGELNLRIQGSTITYHSYDAIGRLSNLFLDTFAPHDHSVTLAYNPAGQIVGRTGTNDLFTYAIGGNSNQASAVNGLNQVASVNGAQLTHDANGNLTGDAGQNGNALPQTYVYDSENRLVTVAGSHIPSGTFTLDYDALGRLRTLSSGTHIVHDGDHPVVEYDSNGAIIRRTLFGPGENQPLVTYNAAGARRMVHSDERGSVIALSDGATAVLQTAAYDEYGRPAPGAFDFPLRYTGQRRLGEAGIYHYRARVYFDDLGRFGQRDPVGYEDQVNLYAYVGNDPISFADPSGKCRTVQHNGRDLDVGICPVKGLDGNDGGAGNLIRSMLADRRSGFAELERDAIRRRVTINVAFADKDDKGNPVDGGRTNAYRESDRRVRIEVTLDPNDVVEYSGITFAGQRSGYFEASIQEIAEHEVVGHGRPYALGRDSSPEEGALDAGNRYSRRIGRPYRRVDHNGRVVRQQNGF